MKRFNFDEFLWFIVLILLDLSVIYLISTGSIGFYIGSNMIKYFYITIVMISIITVFQIKNIFTPKGSMNIKIKLFPIILALIIGFISINKQQTFKHSELNLEILENKTSVIDRKSLYEHEFEYNFKKSNTGNNEETIRIDEHNPTMLDDIRINPEKYIGKKLEIHGFVCKENYLNKNQIIIGRIIMTCCAADSKIVGIVGDYDKSYQLKENDKIKVIGEVGSTVIKDESDVEHRIPSIKIEKLEIEN
ncbi:TIGR03943 family putative permease subunit [Clostridium beijerinckii]|uniref:TIGR03943 family protein n=1 Tax=Clostridium beijerinckii TaxID=1520 RepID=A0A7X9SPF4_CLOBE|nr:TIGR03943 family protein [Clostridium beijerinckii]MCI1584983.1 TIGR03943 family protein [Clostridium beijerinckii]MCI1622424.1 TIGR03943 family protein [Clostridium beijerinckii]NMF05646.1 TIGR03943 family protein [Clostridium beijerinckii]